MINEVKQLNKTARIEFVMTEEEAVRLKETAKSLRLPVSRLIRMLLEGYRPKEFPGDRFFDDLNKLREEANKMQLTSEFVKDPEIKETLYDTAMEIKKSILEIEQKYLLPEKSKFKII